MTATNARNRAHAQLTMLVGTWSERVDLPGIPAGRTSVEWVLDVQFLLQRSEIADPAFPDSLGVIAPAEDGKGYVQHYFDSRAGVVRRYAMTLDEHRWTLLRDRPDSTPLHFTQRFTGTFTDADTITATWERSDDGQHWHTDFDLTYTRNPQPEEATS